MAANAGLRAVIAECLEAIIHQGASLDRELEAARGRVASIRDQGFLQECVYGTLRFLFVLRFQLKTLLGRPLRKRDAILECLLLSGLYQLRQMSIPAHAVVDQAVAACKELDRAWATGLVNGVLRNAERRAQALGDIPSSDLPASWNHPAWFIERLRTAWPADWSAVLAAGNAHPPLTLRVNRLRGTTADYAARLLALGITAHEIAAAPSCLVLEKPVRIAELPDFDSGAVSVQDAAAQLAAPLLDVQTGSRVLDACAAPGGKSMHLLELAGGDCDLQALDISAERLKSVADNALRLGLTCRITPGDAGDPAGWWDGVPFDRILLDAPCSGSGVIRRHPDIKIHRQPADLTQLQSTQRKLLERLWETLQPGGKLLYVTCSVLPSENDDILAAFHAGRTDCAIVPLAVEWGRATGHGRQILSGENGMDGFYFGLLQKRADV
jgi:16S rRNA (cytosine967-C5)-methyltransferase